jgi:hypothetical protein
MSYKLGQHAAYSDEFGNLQLIPGVLRGYRGWRWDGVVRRLVSTGWFHLWGMGRMQPDATCLRADATADALHHTANYAPPLKSCSCGYYASYNPVAYMDQAQLYASGYVHGTISAHGRIVLGTGGFRAQRVRLDALWGRDSEEAADIYNVPWFPNRHLMLAEFPPPDVRQLLLDREVEVTTPPPHNDLSNPVQP